MKILFLESSSNFEMIIEGLRLYIPGLLCDVLPNGHFIDYLSEKGTTREYPMSNLFRDINRLRIR